MARKKKTEEEEIIYAPIDEQPITDTLRENYKFLIWDHIDKVHNTLRWIGIFVSFFTMGVIAFYYGSDFFDCIFSLKALSYKEPAASVARQIRGACDYKIAYPRKACESLRVGAKSYAKALYLVYGACHESSTCVVAKAHAVGDTRSNGYDVLD